MATVTDTIQVSGIRCEQCVLRLAKTLEGADGLESANANLMGQVQLAYDDERTTRDALVEVMAPRGVRRPGVPLSGSWLAAASPSRRASSGYAAPSSPPPPERLRSLRFAVTPAGSA